ncbi:MAG TPA: hypothetical protein VK563_17645 [Puia sp.]|nr:hypothetical protein [Puia sp.]
MFLPRIFYTGIIALFISADSHATDIGMPATDLSADSLLPVGTRSLYKEDVAPDLLEAVEEYDRTRDDRRGLAQLLKIMKIKRLIPDSRRGYRLFSSLARFSARLKLYPLAMKFYSKAGEYGRNEQLSWHLRSVFIDPAVAATDSGEGDPLIDSITYTWLLHMDSVMSCSMGVATISEPVQVKGLRESFGDGKTAVSYALIVHAKQPVPGKRKAFAHINNVGHLFITLIKYNDDNTFTYRSFGFYPHKRNCFSATSLHARSPSVFKDDALHDWDESVGKFISFQRFQKILDLLAKYDRIKYNLNTNNCTDFGLSVAALGGISISDTRGSWPLGKGNNPANAGQSILERKFRNMDADDRDPLFVSNNVR